MFKSLTKRRFCAFLASFFITLVIGFFAWDFASDVVNRVLGYAQKISAENFQASVSSNLPSEIQLSLDDFQQAILVPENEDANQSTETEISETQDSIVKAPSPQDLLDDIAEKLDIIRARVDDLVAESNTDKEDIKKDEEEKKDDELKDEDEKEIEEDKSVKDQKIYPKILIFETKISPADQRFIKLYNPNFESVDLTGWYLQRKTATGSEYASCISKNDFSGKIILPGGYFVISRGNIPANIFVPDLTLTENNSLALKNPNGEISDTAQTVAEVSVTNGGGGGVSVFYPKILISEVQISPTSQRFVELYNPNNQDVSLTNWYLQRRTATGSGYSSFVTKTDFLGKVILPYNYLLISRSDSTADIFNNSLTVTNGNALIFKNPNQEISDSVDLLKTVSPSDGLSLGRKVLEDDTEQDTDNNSADFELQTPTPKFQNIKWSEPVLPDLESIEVTTSPTKMAYFVGEPLDISGLVITGNYSDGSTKIEPIMLANITGFDSTSPSTGQVLTITFEEKITSYLVNIIENDDVPPLPFDIIPPSITTYAISNSLISTTSPTTDIDLAFSEPVKYIIDIFNSVGDFIKNIYKSSDYVTNPRAKNWDGTDISGEIVTNGVYVIKITITDEAKNTTIDASETIAVDNSPPTD
jgi:hypothetical protein